MGGAAWLVKPWFSAGPHPQVSGSIPVGARKILFFRTFRRFAIPELAARSDWLLLAGTDFRFRRRFSARISPIDCNAKSRSAFQKILRQMEKSRAGGSRPRAPIGSFRPYRDIRRPQPSCRAYNFSTSDTARHGGILR